MIAFVRRHPAVLLLLLGVFLAAVAAWAVILIRDARPPNQVVMATGLKGGGYRELGKRYRDILGRHGVRVELRPSRGDLDNLRLLKDERSDVSVAFVSGGLTTESESPGIVSLGAVGYYPLWIFCRGIHEPSRLANLRGKRLSIGPEGSGTRSLSLELFRANDLEESIAFSPLPPAESAEALLASELDCACMLTTGDAPVVRKLLSDKRVELVTFARADAYVAQFPYLREVVVPEGAGSLVANLPPHDVTLVATTTSLLVREDLHPAIQFLLLQAAAEIHSPGGLLNRPGQFPAPDAGDLPLSDEAKPFYKSGGTFFQRHVPFWLWVFTPRLLLLLIPLVGILYPLSKVVPAVVDLVVNSRLDKVYGELRGVDRQIDEGSKENLAEGLEGLEKKVRQMKVPARHARALYTLRQHVTVVRERLGR